jgi:hypothetical protein
MAAMTGVLDARPATVSPAMWIVLGFVAGFVSVLTFHQATIGLMYLLGFVPNPPYNMTPRPPLGVPGVFSGAFWGGVWIMVFAAVTWVRPALRRTNRDLLVAGILWGVIAINLFNWFVLAPAQGRPLGNGFVPASMLRGVIINGMFGLGGAVWMIVGQRLLNGRRL